MVATRQELVDYIRNAAIARGIDPDIAVRVAESEGLNADPSEGWQSSIVSNGVRERSYGPFQLYIDGGLGNVFMEQTGLDPRDPSTVYQQIDFALDQAKQTGWSPWYGAARVGIGDREGLYGYSGAGESLATGEADNANLIDQLFGPGEGSSASYRGRAPRGEAPSDEPTMFETLADAAAMLELSGGRRRTPALSPYINRGRQNVGSNALSRMGIASLA